MPRKKKTSQELTLPLVPLRGMYIFPGMVTNVDVGRSMSVMAMERALDGDRRVIVASQLDPEIEVPEQKDLSPIGIICTVRQFLNLTGDVSRALLEGLARVRLTRVITTEDMLAAFAVEVPEPAFEDSEENKEVTAIVRTAHQLFQDYAEASSRIAPDVVMRILGEKQPGRAADLIAAEVFTRDEDQRDILITEDPVQRLEKTCSILLRETELAEISKRVQLRLKEAVEKNQRDYYLREEIKAIQEELGEGELDDIDDLRKKLAEKPLNEEARRKCEKEIERLSRMTPGTPEIAMSRTYIEWILDLPWGVVTPDNLDLKRARDVLAEDHYGLEKVKERIVEYLAVLQMKQDMKGPILCFVGPPGVGKTSIVRAIAKAVGRKFVQMSLGGVRDEAEIRGHRRTYIGSIPGRIISGIKQAGSMNPVFLFDEIDKMGMDSRGDPASAMLEVLDAEQNSAFRDHYLELPFDLSKVMFITTANTQDSIPAPLLDRMEIIEVPSYTEEEKLQIAKRHLLPKEMAAHGLSPRAVRMSDKVIRSLIEGYTREAGVRTLERTIAQVMRKSAVTMLDTGVKSVTVTDKVLHAYLGAERFTREMPEKEPRVGIVNGLAYTSVGGELLEIECALMPGKGTLKLTGQLGDVMKESAEAAFTWVRAHSEQLKLNPDFYKESDIHIHVPEGAVPKDGPSAGVTMITALVSAVTSTPVRQDVAMTGEITLRGRVLPIGGLKEKTLAAYRAGIRTLIIPKENVKDLEEIPPHVLSQFRIVTAEQIQQVLDVALAV